MVGSDSTTQLKTQLYSQKYSGSLLTSLDRDYHRYQVDVGDGCTARIYRPSTLLETQLATLSLKSLCVKHAGADTYHDLGGAF
jgi:hypothetical protein